MRFAQVRSGERQMGPWLPACHGVVAHRPISAARALRMSLLIDTPRWPWRGRLWAHLISDESLDELHQGARQLGLRYMLFGLDHYDVPDNRFADACEIAEHVDSRVVIRRLRASGLRTHGGKSLKVWESIPAIGDELGTSAVHSWIDDALRTLQPQLYETVGRPGEVVVVMGSSGPMPAAKVDDLRAAPDGHADVVVTDRGQRWSVELVLSTRRLAD